jgi:uncharacterized repeat protein (TIGR03803 family)
LLRRQHRVEIGLKLYFILSIGKLTRGIPGGALIFDASGALYGTDFPNGENGSVFKLSPPIVPGSSWTATLIHGFGRSDGYMPTSGVISDTSGALYGTAKGGGPNSGGVVFKIAPDGTYTILYAFLGVSNDGFGPSSTAPSTSCRIAKTGSQIADGNRAGPTASYIPPANLPDVRERHRLGRHRRGSARSVSAMVVANAE